MKTLCAFLAAVVLLSVPAGAVADGWYSPPPGELAGRQAVQFSIESFLTLSEFQGQMFSYQKFLTDSRAIRVAAGLFLDLTESDLDIEYYSAEQTGSAELSSWHHSGTLKVQMLFYRGDGPLRFFWGGGPKVTYTDNHTENVNYTPYGGEYHPAFEDRVEQRIYSYDPESDRRTAVTTRSPEFSSDGVRFGISARF